MWGASLDKVAREGLWSRDPDEVRLVRDRGAVRWREKQAQEPGGRDRRFSKQGSMTKAEGTKCGGREKRG